MVKAILVYRNGTDPLPVLCWLFRFDAVTLRFTPDHPFTIEIEVQPTLHSTKLIQNADTVRGLITDMFGAGNIERLDVVRQ